SRHVKNGVEAEMVWEGNRCSAVGFRVVADILKASEIRKRFIYFQGKVLTSERLREEIDLACLRAGGIAQHTIVAGGDQACDPHGEGAGPLQANSLIIVDIFPRMKKHGFFGDMTRTFLKGIASDAQKKLVGTVREAQKLGISMVKGNVQGNKIHRAIQNHLKKAGYKTRLIDGVPTGFIHGTGHGLGLELHEQLRISHNKLTLKPGYVLTVEPGLYYPGLGGCRIEDVVWVTKTGCELLSKAPYRWEFK
ncbi:MAG: M24 family metallopeptidase, partial [Verrucomicrobia bacterium]|nr:M24 family metallopeptidase [Verrucomicrobiota bacterium]